MGVLFRCDPSRDLGRPFGRYRQEAIDHRAIVRLADNVHSLRAVTVRNHPGTEIDRNRRAAAIGPNRQVVEIDRNHPVGAIGLNRLQATIGRHRTAEIVPRKMRGRLLNSHRNRQQWK
ncbi:hypothetical protein [Dyella sp. 2HG41-7]|uniref:hypothetical protein n=1 Tax=Dyella sp. 2HG41-7 TaxID=2883239 RepID=UPI001F3DB4DA|nr:hypothetical protein [Dyella sp. 2HG41-7]